jgi:hypothetical protein
MKDKTFEKQVNQDIDQTKKDITTLGEDNVAGLARITKDLGALKEDGVSRRSEGNGIWRSEYLE